MGGSSFGFGRSVLGRGLRDFRIEVGKAEGRPAKPGALPDRCCGRSCPYGVGSAYVPPKMSEFPKVAGQSCCGAGRATVPPVISDSLHASIAGQSAAFLVSFHTAAPYVRVAAAYT